MDDGESDRSTTVAESLAGWFAERRSLAGRPTVTFSERSTGAGFSSETVLFDLRWPGEDGLVRERLVLKRAPVDDPHPLFPAYDLGRQAVALDLAWHHSEAPVPRVVGWEPDPGVLGSPFLVMERLDGVVAPDMPPYTLGGWLHDVSATERTQVGTAFVSALAAVHRVDARVTDLSALDLEVPGDTALERHVAHQRRYYDWIRGDRRFSLVEEVFEWLANRWPAVEAPAGLVWGDSRVANALFDGGRLVALLDWEAAAVGPAELDLAWALYFRDYFQRIAVQQGGPGLPDFLPPERVVARHGAETGREPWDLDWHLVYAALRQALTSIRVSERAVARGQMPEPDHHEGHILDRRHLEDILAG